MLLRRGRLPRLVVAPYSDSFMSDDTMWGGLGGLSKQSKKAKVRVRVKKEDVRIGISFFVH